METTSSSSCKDTEDLEKRDAGTSDPPRGPRPTKGKLKVGVTCPWFHWVPCYCPIYPQGLLQKGILFLIPLEFKDQVHSSGWGSTWTTRVTYQWVRPSVYENDTDHTFSFPLKGKEAGRWVDTGQLLGWRRQPRGYETQKQEAGEPLHFCWFLIYTINHAGQTYSIHGGIFVPCSCVA